jgi:hypothetical protein
MALECREIAATAKDRADQLRLLGVAEHLKVRVEEHDDTDELKSSR